MATIQEINKGDFDSVVSKGVVLVDFKAPWCSACRMLDKVIEQAVGSTDAMAIVAKVDVDKNPELSARYQVHTIPRLLLFKDGRIIRDITGVQSKASLVEMLEM
jgi:thioredoxin 1